MKVYIVKAPQGEYEDYQEPIVKVFLDKTKAKKYIAEENAKLVDETKKVIVRFKVRADGTVPVTGISILPSSLLPLQIQAEIKEQIQLWRFSEESSGLDGTASFDYTLEIR